MKNVAVLFFCISILGVSGCNFTDQKSDTPESELSPVTPADQERYNINSDTEEVINLETDSTGKDSIQQDTLHP